MKMPGSTLRELFLLWQRRNCSDQYLGTLVNAWINEGGSAYGVRAGTQYLDVGTMEGYLKTSRLLYEAAAEFRGIL